MHVWKKLLPDTAERRAAHRVGPAVVTLQSVSVIWQRWLTVPGRGKAACDGVLRGRPRQAARTGEPCGPADALPRTPTLCSAGPPCLWYTVFRGVLGPGTPAASPSFPQEHAKSSLCSSCLAGEDCEWPDRSPRSLLRSALALHFVKISFSADQP